MPEHITIVFWFPPPIQIILKIYNSIVQMGTELSFSSQNPLEPDIVPKELLCMLCVLVCDCYVWKYFFYCYIFPFKSRFFGLARFSN